MKTVKCVIGANFGDEGKGLMTDYFASKSDNSIVVLHNGGAQRGHTVITPEGYRHVFHHFGSGVFSNAYTYMADTFIVNPILFKEEWEKLDRIVELDKVFINKNCKLTTIYDMLLNQVIEIDRGTNKHGSCGTGIFETLYRNQSSDIDFKTKLLKNRLSMTVGEFHQLNMLDKLNFLNYIRNDYVSKRLNSFNLHNINNEYLKVIKSDIVLSRFIDDFNFMIQHSILCDDEILNSFDNIIFESGQGLLLDQHNIEYFPHLTPSNTGIENSVKILKNIGYTGIVEACYVTRTYLTRHGVGKFPTECEKSDINPWMVDMTNVPNPFQDSLRYGVLDKNLVNRCINDAKKGNNELFKIIPVIAITHINEFTASNTPKCTKYMSGGMTRNEIVEVNYEHVI